MNKNRLIFLSSLFLGEKQKQERRWKRNERRSTERESKKDSEREKEESGGGGTQRGKWCSKHFRLKSKDSLFNTQGDYPP